MTKMPLDNQFVETRNEAVLLRLVLSRNGQLAQGEIVNLKGQLIGRFVEWAGLTHTLRACLANRGETPPADTSETPTNPCG